jgi:DNA-binding CsgD family transcriptional regulator
MSEAVAGGEGHGLLALIAAIYDAALDPALWPDVLGRTAAFLPGMSAALFAKDAVSKSGNLYFDDGVFAPEQKQLYFERYVRSDPSNTAHIFAEVEQPISTTDFISLAEFYESRFYREWAKPLGLVDFVCAVLDKSATGAAMFGIFRHERHGLIDDEARRRMRLIVPHVRRAALIGKAIELKTAEAASFAETLDGIASAMFLVNARGRLVHANAAGQLMLANGDVLRVAAGRIAASDPQAGQSLEEVFPSAGAGDAALGVKGIALPLVARNGDRYIAHVLPLTSGARRKAGTSLAAAAAVFVRKAALDARSPLETVAKVYKLTPAELRVMLAVVEIGGAPEVADALGIAETTVKFHLKRLFEKTGTRRQADLVKVVAGYSGALAG